MKTIESICWFPLSKGEWTQVSMEDAALAAEYKWTLTEKQGRKKYAYRSGGQQLHRLLTGALPGEEVDHVNGDGLDNRRGNIRRCEHFQNGRNLTKWKTRTSSKYKGVCLRPNGKWQAYIVLDGKQTYLGVFNTEKEAADRYNVAAVTHHGRFAKLNIICD